MFRIIILCSAAVNEARKLHIPSWGLITSCLKTCSLLRNSRSYNTSSHALWKMMLTVFNKWMQRQHSQTAAEFAVNKRSVPCKCHLQRVDTTASTPTRKLTASGIRRKYNLAADNPIFMSSTRWRKRLDTLLEAVALLPKRCTPIATRAGHGPLWQFLRKQMQALAIVRRVVVIGLCKSRDLPALYNSADIFVMPAPRNCKHRNARGNGLW